MLVQHAQAFFFKFFFFFSVSQIISPTTGSSGLVGQSPIWSDPLQQQQQDRAFLIIRMNAYLVVADYIIGIQFLLDLMVHVQDFLCLV